MSSSLHECNELAQVLSAREDMRTQSLEERVACLESFMQMMIKQYPLTLATLSSEASTSIPKDSDGPSCCDVPGPSPPPLVAETPKGDAQRPEDCSLLHSATECEEKSLDERCVEDEEVEALELAMSKEQSWRSTATGTPRVGSKESSGTSPSQDDASWQLHPAEAEEDTRLSSHDSGPCPAELQRSIAPAACLAGLEELGQQVQEAAEELGARLKAVQGSRDEERREGDKLMPQEEPVRPSLCTACGVCEAACLRPPTPPFLAVPFEDAPLRLVVKKRVPRRPDDSWCPGRAPYSGPDWGTWERQTS